MLSVIEVIHALRKKTRRALSLIGFSAVDELKELVAAQPTTQYQELCKREVLRLFAPKPNSVVAWITYDYEAPGFK